MTLPLNLEDWVRQIGGEEMPVFAQTARHVAGISTSMDTSTAELSRVVLMDSAMTASLLRLANSVYYNPSSKRITTVSRAIVLLGFETVRTMALSIAMVDTMLRGQRHDHVVAEMACAFHAAVQAKALASRRGEPGIEEVFIATLLLRLGAMAFWCFPHQLDEKMEAALAAEENHAKAERSVLGFSFAQLTGALNREWRLSDLLSQVLEGESNPSGKVHSIDIGFRLAVSASRHGWDAPETQKWIGRAAAQEKITEAEARQHIYASVRDAVRAAVDYGAEEAAQRIPLPPLTAGGVARIVPAAEKAGDPELQLRILRELSAMLAERVDLNALLGMVLEGIYRGVVVDRVVLALVSSDGTRLKAKFALGDEADRLMASFNFPLDKDAPNLFAQVLDSREPLWLNRGSPRWKQPGAADIVRCLGETEFFAYPVRIGGRPRGLVYADRQKSRRPLDDRSYDAFRHFCEQAVIGLSVVGQR